jgi:hypothetical protein
MTENKDMLTKVSTFGGWIQKEDGYKWELKRIVRKWNIALGQWLDDSEEIIEQSPEEIGLVRETTVNVLFLKEIPSMDELDGKIKIWFLIPHKFSINKNQGMNLWLRHDNGKLFLLDVHYGQCLEIPFENNANITMKKLKAVRLTVEKAKALAKSTKYVYTKEINGEYVTTVSPV